MQLSVDNTVVGELYGFDPNGQSQQVLDVTNYVHNGLVTFKFTVLYGNVDFVGATLEVSSDGSIETPKGKGYTDLVPDEAMLMLDPNSCSYRPNAVLVDIRSETERYDWVGAPGDDGSGQYMFLENTIHIPYEFRYYRRVLAEYVEITDQRRKNPFFLTEIRRQIPKGKEIILICRTGGRTAEAAREMVAAGMDKDYSIFNVIDGISAYQGWSARGLPMNTHPDRSTAYVYRAYNEAAVLSPLLR